MQNGIPPKNPQETFSTEPLTQQLRLRCYLRCRCFSLSYTVAVGASESYNCPIIFSMLCCKCNVFSCAAAHRNKLVPHHGWFHEFYWLHLLPGVHHHRKKMCPTPPAQGRVLKKSLVFCQTRGGGSRRVVKKTNLYFRKAFLK